MTGQTALAVGLALIGNALIYAGIAFINGRLAPGVLGPVFEATSVPVRTVVMAGLVSLPANWVFAKVYSTAGHAGVAGMAILATLVLVLAAKALLLGEGTVTVRSVTAVAAVLVAAAWAAWELS